MDIVTYALLKKKITSALTGIADIRVDINGQLVFETNDGEIFIISVPGGVLPQDFTVSNGVGKAEKGTFYKAGTSLAEIVMDMLSTYTPPVISIKTNYSTDLFDKVTNTIGDIRVTSKVTPGSKDIQKVIIYINNIIIATFEGEDLVESGDYMANYTFNPATNDSFTIKVAVSDGETTTASKTMAFMGKSYWGFVGENVTVPTEADVKGLQFNELKKTKSLTYSEIKITYGKVLYAYPAALGALTKIVDEDGRNYTNSYTKSTVEVDGIQYYCYLLTDAMGTSNGWQQFN